MLSVAQKIFGSVNDRKLKPMRRRVQKINTLEPMIEALSDQALRAKTDEFRKRLSDGASLDDILDEAFAVVREGAKRSLGMRHFDVQLLGGMVLHHGAIAEMRTGEGKTLVATLPVYLNALRGEGVHVVTVNDYLASRDAEWMGKLYGFLGLTTGVIRGEVPGGGRMSDEERRDAYACDITYGTNNEFGFDYLRDNMKYALDQMVQRRHSYAIVDEVDSILIDEARTPLIISGAAEENTKLYVTINKLAPKLTQQEFIDQVRVFGEEEAEPTGDFMVDEKNRQVELTELGHQKVEQELIRLELLDEGDSLYSATNLNLLHHVHAALKAHALFKRDVDYMVTNGEIVIVDEHTGRAMPGRRWSEGIHQAIEAKEGLAIQNESQTLASTTFQNYFRLYNKLSVMTGTADTEAFEFHQIYGLNVVVIPTHKPMIRDDQNDLIFLTMADKFDAIVEDINERIEKGQPVLVGTASIESSEIISSELDKRGIKHSVLNAKQHAREATIIAQAGMPATVTIATNMAGRGTDIVLGGNVEVEIAALKSPTEATEIDLRELL